MATDPIAVILEDLRSQFKVFGEGLQGVDEKVTRIRDDIERIQEDLAFIKMDLSWIKNELKAKVTREEHAALELRVVRLERLLTERR